MLSITLSIMSNHQQTFSYNFIKIQYQVLILRITITVYGVEKTYFVKMTQTSKLAQNDAKELMQMDIFWIMYK